MTVKLSIEEQSVQGKIKNSIKNSVIKSESQPSPNAVDNLPLPLPGSGRRMHMKAFSFDSLESCLNYAKNCLKH